MLDLCSDEEEAPPSQDNQKKKKKKRKLTVEEQKALDKEEEKEFIAAHQHDGPWGATYTIILNSVGFRKMFKVHSL